MTSHDRSTLTVITVAALASFALVAAPVSRASAQAPVAKAKAALAAAGKSEPVTLDLSKYLVMKPDSFAKIKQYPWAVTPLGRQTFAGVPLEIQGATILWGQRNADRGQKYPEKISDIPCQVSVHAAGRSEGTRSRWK